MVQSRIADNWSLQEILNLFTNGLERDDSQEIILSKGKHSSAPIKNALVQTEALFDFLTDLVLCDEILVDEQFTSAWDVPDSPIQEAKEKNILSAYSFLKDPEKIAEPRERIINHICSTPSLVEAHEKNVNAWNTSRSTPDRILSTTLWGGAGMCARSFVYEKSYTPHPLRKRLFINSGFMQPQKDAINRVVTFISDHKIKVTKKAYGEDSLSSVYINIPSLPIRVIQESHSADQLISTALQMRKEFKSLRGWLTKLQDAMSSGDTASLLEYSKQLDSVSEYIDRNIGYGSTNNPVSMEAGFGIFKMAINGNPIETVKNQFGIRATLNKLILGPSGNAELRKYLNMFGEKGSGLSYEIEQSFTHSIR